MYRYRRRSRKRRRPFRRGYNRTGGYYGRYNKGKRSRALLEKKFRDFSVGTDTNGVAATTTGLILTGPGGQGSFLSTSQGVGEGQRIGRKIILTNLNWRIDIRQDAVLNTAPPVVNELEDFAQTIRIIMYLDKQTNGATATAAQILQLLSSQEYQSFYNLENIGRFKILKDKTYICNGNGLQLGDQTAGKIGRFRKERRVNFFWRGRLPIEYNSTTGAISEIRTFNICGLIIANTTGGTLTPLKIVSSIRIRWIG